MSITRRSFLAAAAALPAVLEARLAKPAAAGLLSAWAERDPNGTLAYFAGRASGAGVRLPTRAHAVMRDSASGDACFVVARRPGDYLVRIDLARGSVSAAHEVDDAACFAGHAIVDRAHRCVLATQIDALTGAGRIGVYDATSLQPVISYSSHGVGPHELLMLEDGVLAVANGGIVEWPETGRSKRNLEAMTPSLALIDSGAGTLQSRFLLPEPSASIRHLALAQDGALGVALQVESDSNVPLLAILRSGALRFAEHPAQPLARYGAGIAACGNRFAVTCTRADAVAVWASDGGFVGAAPMRRPSGIMPDSRRFGWIVSNELGEIVHIDANTLRTRLVTQAARAWDNHLASEE